jgi:antitoxin (DNA-binding transcriptional repressor) of toxin-antitoxin stability system
MKQIRASVFKARCLKIIKEIQCTGEPVVITQRGAPLVNIVAADYCPADLFGFMAGEFAIVGDIEAPLAPLQHWEVHKRATLPDSRVLI